MGDTLLRLAVFLVAVFMVAFFATTWLAVGRIMALQLLGPRPTDRRLFFWIVLAAGGWITFVLSLLFVMLLRIIWFFGRITQAVY